MTYIAYVASAGCLADSATESFSFESPREAWEHVAREVEQIEDDADYLAAHTALHLTNLDAPGSIPAGDSTLYAWHVEAVER